MDVQDLKRRADDHVRLGTKMITKWAKRLTEDNTDPLNTFQWQMDALRGAAMVSVGNKVLRHIEQHPDISWESQLSWFRNRFDSACSTLECNPGDVTGTVCAREVSIWRGWYGFVNGDSW